MASIMKNGSFSSLADFADSVLVLMISKLALVAASHRFSDVCVINSVELTLKMSISLDILNNLGIALDSTEFCHHCKNRAYLLAANSESSSANLRVSMHSYLLWPPAPPEPEKCDPEPRLGSI